MPSPLRRVKVRIVHYRSMLSRLFNKQSLQRASEAWGLKLRLKKHLNMPTLTTPTMSWSLSKYRLSNGKLSGKRVSCELKLDINQFEVVGSICQLELKG